MYSRCALISSGNLFTRNPPPLLSRKWCITCLKCYCAWFIHLEKLASQLKIRNLVGGLHSFINSPRILCCLCVSSLFFAGWFSIFICFTQLFFNLVFFPTTFLTTNRIKCGVIQQCSGIHLSTAVKKETGTADVWRIANYLFQHIQSSLLDGLYSITDIQWSSMPLDPVIAMLILTEIQTGGHGLSACIVLYRHLHLWHHYDTDKNRAIKQTS